MTKILTIPSKDSSLFWKKKKKDKTLSPGMTMKHYVEKDHSNKITGSEYKIIYSYFIVMKIEGKFGGAVL